MSSMWVSAHGLFRWGFFSGSFEGLEGCLGSKGQGSFLLFEEDLQSSVHVFLYFLFSSVSSFFILRKRKKI